MWRKLGLVFRPDGTLPWMASHAAQPVAWPLDGTHVRVFFSPRDRENRAHVASLDLRLAGERFTVDSVAPEPWLSPGARGAFDDSGVSVGALAAVEGRLRLYYLGWTLGTTVPFRNFIGLAEGGPEAGRFARRSPAPVLERSAIDPFSMGYPWVRHDPDGWRMWYGTHLAWGAERLAMRHVIRRATSTDGLVWRPDPEPALALDPADPAEYALSRPCVIREAEGWRMWYSRRNPDYRLGEARSADGVVWDRRDDPPPLAASASGWDSECLCYASVFDHGGRRYMLYNGNGYGLSGFGLALWEPGDA